jgi:hypothetical protein
MVASVALPPAFVPLSKNSIAEAMSAIAEVN